MHPKQPTFHEAFGFWLKLGFISFGGPTGQIAIMHRELVERRRWLSEERFLHALNFCMLLPGPEAQQLATYAGWALHGIRGALVAGVLFVLPSAILLWGLSWLYVAYGDLPAVEGVFAGLKPAVLAIVAAAVIRIGQRVLKTPAMWCVAGAALGALLIFHAPFPALVVAAAGAGFIGGKWRPDWFAVLKPHGKAGDLPIDERKPMPGWGRNVRVAGVCLALWWLPVGVAAALLGGGHVLTQMGLFFSKAALVTFGGAYAVLPYVSQQAVVTHGWLDAGEMLDGLGLAETTPGPLIMVLQFVGFLGAWKEAAPFSPLVSATLGAGMTTWVTFAPSFLWILLGAPYLDYLRGHRGLTAALSAITAAVVGVVLNLAIWFAWHVLRTEAGGVQWAGVVIAVGAFGAMQRWKVEVIPVIGVAAVLGLAGRLLGWM
jgi:chromate transporter